MRPIILIFLGYAFLNESFHFSGRKILTSRLKFQGLNADNFLLSNQYLPLIIGSVNAYNLKKSSIEHKITVNELATQLDEWNRALVSGILPDKVIWPPEPLLSKITSTFNDLELPKLSLKHNELVPTVLKSILKLAIDYQNNLNLHEETYHEDSSNELLYGEDQIESFNQKTKFEVTAFEYNDGIKAEAENTIASNLVKQFKSNWGPPLGSLSIMDEIYGSSHGLMNFQQDQPELNGGGGDGFGGFGLFNGIWQHTGWTIIKDLQNKLKDMIELKDLMRLLGKRPSETGKVIRKTPPQRSGNYLGVHRSMNKPIETTGIKRSSSFEGLLPSEAFLLSYSKSQPITALKRNAKLLFLSKLAESSLASYERSDWEENYSKPAKRPWKYYEKLPVEIGGPIILCLDTSWSMSGSRENLAKSVVLECAQVASKTKRSIYILAFSGMQDLEEFHIDLTVSKKGLQSLLNFLSQSFKGGTDVTRPLERAIELLDTTEEWASADLLLVTDGELQTPPVDISIIEKLRRLENERGLEVHGLMVGRNSSVPLSMLCTDWDGEYRVHTFLNKYDLYNILKNRNQNEPTSGIQNAQSSYSYSKTARSQSLESRRKSFKLYASSKESIESIQTGKELDTIKENSLENIARLKSEILKEHESNICIERSENKELLNNLIKYLEVGLIEREEEVRLLILTSICKEHLLLLGPPGTGKSELGKRLASLTSSRIFERLLTKYSTPEELFGPLSLLQLEKDKYVRNTAGYLPDSKVAFLDEIFKANSAILNSLLTILNERKFDNGADRIDIPLLALVGASNELPSSEELEALYDRFLFRKLVKPVSDTAIYEFLKLSNPSHKFDKSLIVKNEFTIDENMIDLYHQATQNVSVPPIILNLLRNIRIFLRDELDPPVICSDRRLLKAVKMLSISAVTNGRNSINIMDCLLLKHLLWYSPEDQDFIVEWLWDNLIPNTDIKGYQFLAKNLNSRVISVFEKSDSENISPSITEISSEISVLIDILIQQFKEIENIRVIFNSDEKNIWLSSVDNISLRQRLGQSVVNTSKSLETLLFVLYSLYNMINNSTLDPLSIPDLASSIWEEYIFKENQKNVLEDNKDLSDIDIAFDHAVNSKKLSSDDLNLSKKEAQSKLSSSDFKLWKKAQKSLKRQKSDEDED